MHATERLVRKLRLTTALDAADIAAVERMPVAVRDFPAHSAIVHEGERPAQCCLIVEGYACRSKTTDSGKRQILSIHVSGDIPDLQSLHLHVMDHDLTTLSRCTLAFISHDAIRALTRERPLLGDALWRETLVDAAIFREWIVNVGRRSAASRMAHLLAEIGQKLEAIGLADGGRFELPMTQLDLADALGLSSVHVNRVIQELRRDGLLDMRKQSVSLLDLPRITKLADFDPLYLHQHQIS